MPFTLRALVAIAALKRGPQILPASTVVLGLTVALDAAFGAVVVGILQGAANVTVVLATVLLSLAFTYLALYLRGLTGRFTQTAIALFGTDLLINAVALPLAAPSAAHMAAESTPPTWLLLALVAVLGWSLAVLTNIFGHALDLSRTGAFLVALAYFFVTSGVLF